jgi:hypothetical protein
LGVLQAQKGCQTFSFLFDVHHPICGGEVSNISSTAREYKLRLETRNNNVWFCLPVANLRVDVFHADSHRSNRNAVESRFCVSCTA